MTRVDGDTAAAAGYASAVALELAIDEDAGLVARARDGDYGAFEQLVKKHQRRVFALAMGILRNPAEAEEVVQETFLSAFSHLDTFRGDARFSTWIHRVASNHALMRIRKKKPDPQGDATDLEPRVNRADTEGTSPFDPLSLWARRPDDALQSKQVTAALDEALDELDDEDRALVLLRSMNDASHEDLAHQFGATVPAIKSRLHRARLELRRLLEEKLRGSPPT